MNWQHLRYFEVIAKEEHFTRAAEQLHITQSALSKAIDSLEKELGTPLFDRSGRNIRLNKYGRLFRNNVIYATSEVEKGMKVIQQMSQSSTGTVSFSSIFSMGADFIPMLIKSFSQRYPKIRLSYYQKSTRDILNDVLDGRIEFGFCGEFPAEEEYANIEKELVKVEEIVLAVPQNHPFAQRSSIPFEELMEQKFIGYTNNTGIIYSLEDTLSKAGFATASIEQDYLVAEDNTLVGMVRAGLGIGLVARIPSLWTDGVALVQVIEPFLSRKLYMVWSRSNYMSPAAKSFKYHVLASINRPE